jgi:hypothetical protein
VQGRVPAKVGQVKAQGQAGLKEILAFLDLIGLFIDVDYIG